MSLTMGFLFGSSSAPRWSSRRRPPERPSCSSPRATSSPTPRAGGWGRLGARINAGFAANAFSYLLFLRLVPLFPFFLVNLAPAFTTIGLRTYVAATLIGIVPGTFVYVNLGRALGRIESTSQLVSRRGAGCAGAARPVRAASRAAPKIAAPAGARRADATLT